MTTELPEPKLMRVFLRPLHIPDLDSGDAEGKDIRDLILGFMRTPESPEGIEDLLARYKEISGDDNQVIAAPYEEKLFEKLVWPLRNAKASYILGMYLGTLALCGMVAEMLALLLFEIHEFHVNGLEMNNNVQEKIFGRTFEKLGQERRVSILSAYGTINAQMESDFALIRNKRNYYLHYLSHNHGSLKEDARQAYKATVALFVAIFGQNISGGILKVNPALIQHLEKTTPELLHQDSKE